MVDRGLLAWRTSEDGRLPSIEVRVEVDDGDGTVGGINRAQKREDDSVVSTESDNPRMLLSILRDAYELLAREGILPELCCWLTVQERPVAVLNLFNRELVVVRRDGNVSTIDNSEICERVDSERDVVAAVEG